MNESSLSSGFSKRKKWKEVEGKMWIPSPSSYTDSNCVLGVWVSENEEVDWQWTHTQGGQSLVTGYTIKKKTDGKRNSKKIIRVSYTSVRGDDEEKKGLLIVGKDITYERESHSNLIRGNSYLVLDELNKSSIDLFSNFTKMGYSGLFITRTNIDFVKNISLYSLFVLTVKTRGFMYRFNSFVRLYVNSTMKIVLISCIFVKLIA